MISLNLEGDGTQNRKKQLHANTSSATSVAAALLTQAVHECNEHKFIIC